MSRNPHFLTSEEARAIFERQAQNRLGISTEEFLRRLDTGEYDVIIDTPDVMSLVMLLPSVRSIRS